jgi:hypothetical protein
VLVLDVMIGLSFSTCEYETVRVDLNQQQTATYNLSVDLWVQILKTLEWCSRNPDYNMSKSVLKQYWSSHQRFFRQLCLAAKVPMVLAETRAALAQGMAVVIGLQTTGEASMFDMIKQGSFVFVCC